MTTGFQLQHHTYSPIMKAAPKPHQMGSRLKFDEGQELVVAAEKRSFKDDRENR